MQSYSTEEKQRIITKVKSGQYGSIAQVAKNENIPAGTLYSWMNPVKNDKKKGLSKQKNIVNNIEGDNKLHIVEISDDLHKFMKEEVPTKTPSVKLTMPSGAIIEFFS